MQMKHNGISFSDVNTLSFTQTPIYTQDKVEYLWDEFEIKVSALFTNSPNAFPPGNLNESPAQTYLRLIGCLSKKRKTLIYGDTAIVINSPRAGANTDANWGPEPQVLSCTQLTPTTWRIEFSVKTWLYDCCGNNSLKNTKPFIANRWSEVSTIDENFVTTVTRSGRLYFRADGLNNIGNLGAGSTDTFRSVIVAACPLRNGFKRYPSQYKLSDDGLTIEYTISDVQQYCMPFKGLTKFEAEYKVLSQKGVVFDEEMHVRVWGPPAPYPGPGAPPGGLIIHKTYLYQIASQILMSRLDEINGTNFLKNGEKKKMTLSSYWSDRLHENYVEIYYKTRSTTGSRNTFFGSHFPDIKGFDPQPGLDSEPPNVIPNPGTYGWTAMKLVSASLCDPCLNAACPNLFSL